VYTVVFNVQCHDHEDHLIISVRGSNSGIENVLVSGFRLGIIGVDFDHCSLVCVPIMGRGPVFLVDDTWGPIASTITPTLRKGGVDEPGFDWVVRDLPNEKTG